MSEQEREGRPTALEEIARERDAMIVWVKVGAVALRAAESFDRKAAR